MRQDDVYKMIEADQFFDRNQYDFNQLPLKKRSLLDNHFQFIESTKVNSVLEIGCHIGDLLNYTGQRCNSKILYGIEPSEKAIKVGKKMFPDCNFINGVLADESISKLPKFDLTILNDVFCWISRDTLFDSIANIDRTLNIGGMFLLRDFLPDRFIENRNKHVEAHEVLCFKIPGSHGNIFLNSGKYKLISSKVFMGNELGLSKERFGDQLEDRWIEMLLVKVR